MDKRWTISATVKAAFLFIVLCLCGIPAAHAQQISGVGLTRLAVLDPIGGRPMDAAVFYPSRDRTTTSSLGPYIIDGFRGASLSPGRHPLVVISHGSRGSLWGHHSLASFLARRGYIVVSVTHPGDNFQNSGGAGATSTFYGRPLQASAALTAVTSEPFFVSSIDQKRIGFIGFSAGGGTGLMLAGASPAPARLEAYCATRPDDRHVCEAGGRLRNDRSDLAASTDLRIRALVLMAPLSIVYPPEQLKNIAIPTLIYAGEDDEELDTAENAGVLARELSSLSTLKIVPDAGHFVFLSPCSTALAEAVPAICADPAGIDRRALHDTMNLQIAQFLTSKLGAAPE